MQEPFENQLRQHVSRLKARDRENTPSFDDVIGRPLRQSRPIISRPVLAVVCGITLLTIVGVSRSVFVAGEHDKQRAMNSESATADVAELTLDFDAMLSAIDSHFESQFEIDWTTPTDTLLTTNLKDPIDDSFLQ